MGKTSNAKGIGTNTPRDTYNVSQQKTHVNTFLLKRKFQNDARLILPSTNGCSFHGLMLNIYGFRGDSICVWWWGEKKLA